MVLPDRRYSLATIGWLCLLLAALFTTVLFQSAPKSEQVWIVEGTIRSARWVGAKNPALLVRLDGDPRDYLINDTVLRDRGRLPAEVSWAGKAVRLGVTGGIVGRKGYRKTFSLEVDGQVLYELDDVRQFHEQQFWPSLAVVSGAAAMGVVLLWAHRRRAQVAAGKS